MPAAAGVRSSRLTRERVGSPEYKETMNIMLCMLKQFTIIDRNITIIVISQINLICVRYFCAAMVHYRGNKDMHTHTENLPIIFPIQNQHNGI